MTNYIMPGMAMRLTFDAIAVSRFEGLTREGVPHGKGVLVIGNGSGGGLKRPSRGDRYQQSS